MSQLKINKLYPNDINTTALNSCHLVMGISPFNSFFSVDNITAILEWAKSNSKSFQVFFPDQISIYTLMSLGYQEKEALHKIRKQENYLTNKIIQSLKNIHITDEIEQQKKIIKLSELKNNKSYIELLDRYKKLFAENKDFYDICVDTSEQILEQNHRKKEGDEVINFNNAHEYLIQELPIPTNIGEILNIEKCVFVYKTIPKVLLKIYQNAYPISAGNNFLVLEGKEQI
ncbi:Cyclodipeptide synthase [Alphaproteobacteria bacterium]